MVITFEPEEIGCRLCIHCGKSFLLVPKPHDLALHFWPTFIVGHNIWIRTDKVFMSIHCWKDLSLGIDLFTLGPWLDFWHSVEKPFTLVIPFESQEIGVPYYMRVPCGKTLMLVPIYFYPVTLIITPNTVNTLLILATFFFR